MSQVEIASCRLRLVAEGRAEPCPQETCVFWETGGAVAAGRCAIERLGFDLRRPDLARYLLETRLRFEQAWRL